VGKKCSVVHTLKIPFWFLTFCSHLRFYSQNLPISKLSPVENNWSRYFSFVASKYELPNSCLDRIARVCHSYIWLHFRYQNPQVSRTRTPRYCINRQCRLPYFRYLYVAILALCLASSVASIDQANIRKDGIAMTRWMMLTRTNSKTHILIKLIPIITTKPEPRVSPR